MQAREHQFKVGDKAVYPAQGVAEVVSIDEKDIAGTRQRFYVLRPLDTDHKIMVPVLTAASIGLDTGSPFTDTGAALGTTYHYWVTAANACGVTCGWECAPTGCNDVTDLSVNAGHACVVLADRSVRCWGFNVSGQLGDGTTEARSRPVVATDVSEAVVVAAGNEHTCVATSASEVWCWGSTEFGRLGDGTTTDGFRATAARVSGLSARSVATGGSHSCALTGTGELYCWGANGRGQVGDGATRGSTTSGWP